MLENSQYSRVSSSARQTVRSELTQQTKMTKANERKQKLLNSTDMILMQRETEKLGREAFSKIKQC